MNPHHLEEIRAIEKSRKDFVDFVESREKGFRQLETQYTERFISQCVERIESRIKFDLSNGIKNSSLTVDDHCGVNYIPDFKDNFYGKTSTTCDVYEEIHKRIQTKIKKWTVPVKFTPHDIEKSSRSYSHYCSNCKVGWTFTLN